MKLLYATSITLPSYRANRLQVMGMARAFFARLGADFVLGVSEAPEKERVGLPVIEEQGRSFRMAWRYLSYAKEYQVTHIYCREEKLLFFMLVWNVLYFRRNIIFVYELHHLVYTRGFWRYALLNQVHKIVSITAAMKEELVRAGYPNDRILVSPDGVDLALFDSLPDKKEARQRVGLPQDKKIIMYTGDLSNPWKGVETLYDASGSFDDSYLFVLVGSKPHHVAHFRTHNPARSNVIFRGYEPHEEIPFFLRSADVAVLPNSGKSEISRIATSPLKLFEYMASETPIVASDLPSVREILSERSAFLVSPDDPHALARGIVEALRDPEEARRRTREARQDVSGHTWQARADAVLSFIQ